MTSTEKRSRWGGYLSLMHGTRPEYRLFDTQEEEIAYIIDEIEKCRQSGINYEDIVIGCQFKDSLRTYQTALHNAGIPYRNLQGRGRMDGVALSTLHRMKGLEYKIVILADINEKTFNYIPQSIDQSDSKAMKMYDQTRRSLMYVAITRAMQRVILTGVGRKAETLEKAFE